MTGRTRAKCVIVSKNVFIPYYHLVLFGIYMLKENN